MNAVIKTTNLTKAYGKHNAVDRLQMNVLEGQIYGFLGQNGAGKTTTIRMLLGLIQPTEGQIEIFGELLRKRQRDILRRVGSIVEFSGFYGNLTAKENLMINAKLMGVHTRNAVMEALEIAGLEQESGKLVGKYSLGMKQRLGIARAILHHPELLILDEPTNGLDPVGIAEIRRLIQTLAVERKVTILISSHILHEIELLAERIGIIHEGKLLEEVDMDTLKSRNRKYVEFQVSNPNSAAMLIEQYGINSYEVLNEGIIRLYTHLGEQGRLNRLFVEHGIEVSRIAESETQLEDYFVRLTGGVPYV
ncbi:ABC transporter ATP-binding protein [Paenibacillus tuaregi]|uniref:ABC transporter ATP-binding protein n=1 Tax=Paenibacillus tuaregi TaxID=1816681 RepID=UPI000838EFC8|nr:ABC transporter ATP-binding protein [Paenibacillus tuaregi]